MFNGTIPRRDRRLAISERAVETAAQLAARGRRWPDSGDGCRALSLQRGGRIERDCRRRLPGDGRRRGQRPPGAGEARSRAARVPSAGHRCRKRPTCFAAVLAAADQIGAGLIVMASHGRQGLSAVVLGSETQRLLTTPRFLYSLFVEGGSHGRCPCTLHHLADVPFLGCAGGPGCQRAACTGPDADSAGGQQPQHAVPRRRTTAPAPATSGAGSAPVRLAPRDPALEAWKRAAALRIHQANQKQLFEGRPHHLLQAVIVVEATVDRTGNVVGSRVTRSPKIQSLDQMALASLKAASPLPAPPATLLVRGNLVFSETWLVQNDGRFQVRTLALPQE